MDNKKVRKKLGLVLLRGSLAYTKHASERMSERKFTAQDVMRALSGGTMSEGPREVKHTQGFECVMRTRLDDGRILEVPIVVDEKANKIIVISVVRKSK